jgi:hypothetical protein
MNHLSTPRNSIPSQPSLSVMLKRSLGVLMFSVTLWLSTEILAPSWAHANLPVIDVTAISQMLAQYVQTAKQLETMIEQVALLKQEISSMTGHYGMGNVGGSVNGWGGTTWADIADMVGQGINPGDAAQVRGYKEARARYTAQFPALANDLQTGNPRMNAAYNRSYSDARTGTALGESTFDQVDTYLADIETLKNRIDQTDNLKNAMDLNTAVTVRVAQLNGEILRIQSAQLRLQAANQTQTANGSAAEAEFFAQ